MGRRGSLSSRDLNRHQLHSDLVDTFARRGVPGLVSLMALYGVPLWLFWRHWRRSGDEQARTLALCGVLIVVGFVGFGLSHSMLRDVWGLSGSLAGKLLQLWGCRGSFHDA